MLGGLEGHLPACISGCSSSVLGAHLVNRVFTVALGTHHTSAFQAPWTLDLGLPSSNPNVPAALNQPVTTLVSHWGLDLQ